MTEMRVEFFAVFYPIQQVLDIRKRGLGDGERAWRRFQSVLDRIVTDARGLHNAVSLSLSPGDGFAAVASILPFFILPSLLDGVSSISGEYGWRRRAGGGLWEGLG